MKKVVIEIKAAEKRFGTILAVDAVDISVYEGEIFGLIGHNGAGKSTLFKMMLGLLPMSSGEIKIHGESINKRDYREVRTHIGYLPENVVFYDGLTGIETLNFYADLKGVTRNTCQAMLEKVGLSRAANRKVANYSKGMRQRLGFAQAMLGNPTILFLDEPTNGLDPEGIGEFYKILGEMQEYGVTMILTSHILAEIQQRVDRLAIMRLGKIHALGTVQELREGMDFPLTVIVRMCVDAFDALDTVMKEFGLTYNSSGESIFTIRCPRDKKMPLLNALALLAGKVIDIDIKEPSLEDVFLGYSA